MKSTGPLKCAIAGFLCTKFELNQIKIGLALFGPQLSQLEPQLGQLEPQLG